jgi:hypothetical protein
MAQIGERAKTAKIKIEAIGGIFQNHSICNAISAD